MNNIAERYIRLSRAYVQLSDKFQQLDVDHMALRGQIAPLLKSLKAHKSAVERLQQEKGALEAELQTVTAECEQLRPLAVEKATWEATLQAVTAKYEVLRPLEALLSPDSEAVLAEAEAQLDLIDQTTAEMAMDADPDLNDEAKQLLADYAENPEAFMAADLGTPMPDLRLSQLQREKVLLEP
jgi:chromosome segregation ATPase